ERVEDPTRLPTYNGVQSPKSKVQSPAPHPGPLPEGEGESKLNGAPGEGGTPDDPAVQAAVKGIIDRLQLELKVIEKTGFLSYFLIVGDFVRYGHQNGISCVARGSAAGSIVTYLLEISN